MGYQQHKQFALDKLAELTAYSTSIVAGEERDPRQLHVRPRYLYGLFIMSLSITSGVQTLINQNQPRNALILLRSQQEAWINAFFTYSHRSNVWIWYQLFKGEESNLKKARQLSSHSDEVQIERLSRELSDIKRYMTSHYHRLPRVDGVISQSSSDLTGSRIRDLSLLDKCKIIDACRYNSINGPFEQSYKFMYSFFSEIAHITPRGVNTIFAEDETSVYLDVHGGYNKTLTLLMLYTTYRYHYDLLKMYHSTILHGKALPEDTKASRRAMERLFKKLYY